MKTERQMFLEKHFNLKLKKEEYLIGLCGNPNVGKSSLFNLLTGLHQHTGNWPGKTVQTANGRFKIENSRYLLVDVPGTYSLYGLSEEELVTRDFILFSQSDIVIVVCDAAVLERNLLLLYQTLEHHKKVILVVNLIDEASKKGIEVNEMKLSAYLGIPVVLTSCQTKEGIARLKKIIHLVAEDKYQYTNIFLDRADEISRIFGDESLKKSYVLYQKKELLIDDNPEKRDFVLQKYQFEIAELARKCLTVKDDNPLQKDIKVDNVVTHRFFGKFIMIFILLFIFYLTVNFANYPSELLSTFFNNGKNALGHFLYQFEMSNFIYRLLMDGIFDTVTTVVSVMLPPMLIFFILFSILEDIGYLPRVAYNMDGLFQKNKAHGKQCLTMCLGLGCNAAGVVGCRVIDSKRDKMVAMLTNNFMPCNGRFPLIISISIIFFAVLPNAILNSFVPSFTIFLLVVLGIVMTFLSTRFFSKTIFKGESSTFTLELPAYRKPKLSNIIYNAIFSKTISILLRAVVVCIPAGILIFLLANIKINENTILYTLVNFLNPLGEIIGLDGTILLAFILGLPANEIVLPIMLMIYLRSGVMVDISNYEELRNLLVSNGWTILTAINVLLFSLLHFPCATTLLTIRKESSTKWAVFSFFYHLIIAFVVCFLITLVFSPLIK